MRVTPLVRKVENNWRTETPEHDVEPASTQLPEDRASHQEREPGEICKTSIPGSNPGGASKIIESARSENISFRSDH
jgi:hypothetical protein